MQISTPHLACTPAPASVPPVEHWPSGPERRHPGPDQPPLPGTAGSRPRIPGASGQPSTRSGYDRVSVITTGRDWSPAHTAGLPDPASRCVQLAQVIVEVHQGLRPVQHLRRWLTDRALTAVQFAARRTGGARSAASLHAVRLQSPSPGAVEAVALFRIRGREEAMALRLEARGEHWLCTAYESQPASGAIAADPRSVTHPKRSRYTRA